MVTCLFPWSSAIFRWKRAVKEASTWHTWSSKLSLDFDDMSSLVIQEITKTENTVHFNGGTRYDAAYIGLVQNRPLIETDFHRYRFLLLCEHRLNYCRKILIINKKSKWMQFLFWLHNNHKAFEDDTITYFICWTNKNVILSFTSSVKLAE